MPRILIVDDEPAIVRGLEDNLRFEGYETLAATSGEEGLARALGEAPDLVLLDVMMPKRSGWDVCRELRQRGVDVPIIMLTARGEESERIAGLELGADDYVTKPFSPRELTARVAALLRRLQRPPAPAGSRLAYGPITVDTDRHAVSVDGEEIKLTAKEFLLLQYLIEHRGRVLSRDLLLTDVWGYQYTGGTRTVDVHIRRLREKLPYLADAIVTIKQFGYRLDDR